MDYNKQATDFLKSTDTNVIIEFLRNGKHFDDDKENRDVYKVTIKRGGRRFSFEFGNSTSNSQYYQDNNIKERTYNTCGAPRSGGYRILDISKYMPYISLKSGTPPSEYDILTCLTKYDVGSFEDFCDEYGYDTDSRKAKKTYKAVEKEYTNVCKIWSDVEIEQLQEIQ